MNLQALDSFVSSIPGFEGETPILVIPILARTPSAESANDSSVGPSVRFCGLGPASASLPLLHHVQRNYRRS
jgi:hypothetical protein